MIPKFSKVLVATDCSETANRSVPFAYSIVESDGEVHLIHVIEHEEVPNPLYSHYSSDELNRPDKRKEVAAEVVSHLKKLIPKGAEEKGIKTVVDVAFHGDVPEGIVEESKQRGVECVVVGSHGRSGLVQLLMGSVAESVLRACPVPVLIVPYRG